MRILTGKDREAYDLLLQQKAMFAAEGDQLEIRVAELLERVKALQADCTRERQRADTAVDELLAIRGIPPISPQPPMAPSGDFNPLAEDPEEAARIEKRMLEMGPAAVLAEMKP